jgi:tRNA A-37 threonylcarbamoyl transferase component Bud32
MPAEAPDWVCADCETSPGRASSTHEPEEPLFGPAPAELAPLFAGLEILEVAGRGGMGTIYKARQPQLDRLVALKILSPELGRDPAFAERFAREAQALAKLNHSNIVGIFDFGQSGGFFYFLMEYVDGVTLRQLIEQKLIHPEEAQRIVIEICYALQYAHEEGIVHLDIKPSNILLDKKGRVKIADFGLARLMGKKAGDTSGGDRAAIMGTPPYMAPEQLERPRKVDRRADIYALGVVFYEMLTGELPVGSFEPPSRKAQVDPRLDAVVLRALAREPRRRFSDAGEVRAAVEKITGIYQNLPGDMPRRPQRRKWKWLPRFALAAGAFWLAIVSYILLQQHLSEQKSVLIPAGALEAFAAGPEGMGIGRRVVTALGLNLDQTKNVNRILRRYQREFTDLEHGHTDRSSNSAGHDFVTIKPFPQEMDELMNRMWADMAAVLNPSQIAKAKTLHFERFFPHTGKTEVNLEVWQGENGEYHDLESQLPRPRGAAAGSLPPRSGNGSVREDTKTDD